MTIQEYIRVAANGLPKEDYLYYRRFFWNMNCKWCMYNGYACRRPKTDDVCIEYRVERQDIENRYGEN